MRHSPQIQVVCTEIVWPTHCMFDFGFQQFRPNGGNDIHRYFVLERKNVAEIALKSICPNMRAGARVDQLTGDAHPSSDLADTALQNVTDTKFAADMLD